MTEGGNEPRHAVPCKKMCNKGRVFCGVYCELMPTHFADDSSHGGEGEMHRWHDDPRNGGEGKGEIVP